jgi:hypothetical protein
VSFIATYCAVAQGTRACEVIPFKNIDNPQILTETIDSNFRCIEERIAEEPVLQTPLMSKGPYFDVGISSTSIRDGAVFVLLSLSGNASASFKILNGALFDSNANFFRLAEISGAQDCLGLTEEQCEKLDWSTIYAGSVSNILLIFESSDANLGVDSVGSSASLSVDVVLSRRPTNLRADIGVANVRLSR